MIAFADTRPDTDVQPSEYHRLLGYPRGWELDGRASELAQLARAWYGAHGRPWVLARQATTLDLTDPDGVVLEGVRFTAPRLHAMLAEAGADAAVLVAASAGPELEAEAGLRWREEKPDEYFFLEAFGSAVVEHLVTRAGARLCAAAEERGLAVLPHYSPGYPGWDIAEQAALARLLRGGDAGELPGPLEVLCSGALKPKKSLLAVFGVTARTERVRPLTDLVPCQSCSLPGCRYRRAAYGSRPARSARPEVPAASARTAPLTLEATYRTGTKALRRWASERLTLTANADGTTDAIFRYEGSTCTDMGRAFCFHYAVKLAPRAERYRILDAQCAPAPGDDGHTFMCRYRNSGARLLETIARERPLLGEPLDAVLTWSRAPGGATCYCETATHAHKWGLALETIHFALAQEERSRGTQPITTGAQIP